MRQGSIKGAETRNNGITAQVGEKIPTLTLFLTSQLSDFLAELCCNTVSVPFINPYFILHLQEHIIKNASPCSIDVAIKQKVEEPMNVEQ